MTEYLVTALFLCQLSGLPNDAKFVDAARAGNNVDLIIWEAERREWYTYVYHTETMYDRWGMDSDHRHMVEPIGCEVVSDRQEY
jgi:hypothetical protein